MASQYVADDNVILCMQGLRWIMKTNKAWAGGQDFILEWDYKESAGSAEYKDEESRNAMYNKVREELVKQNEHPPEKERTL